MESSNRKLEHVLTVVALAMTVFVCIMLVFCAGVWVGQKRAEFSYRWAENYHRNFGGPAMGMLGNFPSQEFTTSHGVFGQVLEINGNQIIVKGQDNVEKTIVVSSKTVVRNNKSIIAFSQIRVGDTIIVIGSPNAQGQVQAEFIRLLPSQVSCHFYMKNES